MVKIIIITKIHKNILNIYIKSIQKCYHRNKSQQIQSTGVCTPNEHTFLNCPSRGTGSWIFSNSFFNCFLIMKLRPREKILHIQLC